MRAEITTSCRTAGTRYSRLNQLGWALLCPYARDLIIHGAVPVSYTYPTAEEASGIHDKIKRLTHKVLLEILGSLRDVYVVSVEPEYRHSIGFRIGHDNVCADSRADLAYTLYVKNQLITLYVEAATRIHVAKPLQALLRGIALYYERRTPVWIIMVSPSRVQYKLLEEKDQDRILKLLNRKAENFSPSQNLCSLCEFVHFCPHRMV